MTESAARAATPPTANFEAMTGAIRALSMDAVQAANSGHPGMPMGMADVATVLFRDFLKFDASQPNWPDRDRFVLSAGHGSMLLYSLLYLTGYEDMTLDEIKNFRQLGSRTCGHPEYGHAGGIETTTGPLGQGITNAVGMAMAERLLSARYGDELVDHYTYTIAGDGCLMEGISQEAISLAGHLKLSKLIVLWDDNDISIDGPISLSSSEDQLARFKAAGFDVQAIDGHDEAQIAAAIAKAQTTDTPSMIACKTVIGKGAPTKAGTSGSHGAPLGEDEIAGARKAINWPHVPFDIPEDVLSDWREVGTQGAAAREAWEGRLAEADNAAEFLRTQAGELPAGLDAAVAELKQQFASEQPKLATRASSGKVLEKLVQVVPELIGGSADLTGSNLTKTSELAPVTPDDFSGRYIYWGIREHGMASAMNGMILHGGMRPYGGTFFVFTDYCRPAIRLAALMGIPAVYVMTHDSIGLGEDGPTHQPVEHLASLRAMPNLRVLRPADAKETAEAWEIALKRHDGPTMLVLTRQGVKMLSDKVAKENESARGAYVVSGDADAAVTIIGTGSEVGDAVEAAEVLTAKGTSARVVSMPSMELFLQQDEAYKADVLGNGLRVGIEAAIGFGWEQVLGADGIFIGMQGFGGSAPAADLYKEFGITADAIVAAVDERLGN